MNIDDIEPVKLSENYEENNETTVNTPIDAEKDHKLPNKDGHFNVLHKDGSFADMPYNNEPGAGPDEGVVGIGT